MGPYNLERLQSQEDLPRFVRTPEPKLAATRWTRTKKTVKKLGQIYLILNLYLNN